MTLFTTPMARQFVGFDTLFDELNRVSERKESNYPAYNIAKDDDEHYRIEVALAGFSADEISIQSDLLVTAVVHKMETLISLISIEKLHGPILSVSRL